MNLFKSNIVTQLHIATKLDEEDETLCQITTLLCWQLHKGIEIGEEEEKVICILRE